MSNLWNDIKENVKQWSTSAIEKAEEVSKLAVEKTGDFTKISKIKLDIRQTNKDIDNVFEDLGRYVYLQAKEKKVTNFKTNAEFDESIKKIDDFKAKIKDFESEIDSIKKEVEEADVVEEPKTKSTKKSTTAKTKQTKTTSTKKVKK